MSIATDILALNPIAYWKLDDAMGPVASDSSGNGNAGTIGGAFTLGVLGPEAGSTCMRLGAAGATVVGLTTPFIGRQSHTLFCYVSFAPTNAQGNYQLAKYGDAGGTLRGVSLGLTVGAGTSLSNFSASHRQYFSNGIIGSPIFPAPPTLWHCLCVVMNASTNNATGYADTSAGSGTPWTTGVNYTNPIAGDCLSIKNVACDVLLAHVALFPVALSGAQIATLVHTATWPFGITIPMVNDGTVATQTSVTALQTDLTTVLSAVRRTVPPTP